jgi:hypothetical protein
MTADCKPDPAEQGREAYGDDKTLDDNPYVMGTPEYVTWNQAFEEARKNDPLADICGGDDDLDDDDEADE